MILYVILLGAVYELQVLVSSIGQTTPIMEHDLPVFKESDFSTRSSDLDVTTAVALVAFMGTLVFCAVQAIIAPRRTFCSMKAADD